VKLNAFILQRDARALSEATAPSRVGAKNSMKNIPRCFEEAGSTCQGYEQNP
jgi:hypothetical protein